MEDLQAVDEDGFMKGGWKEFDGTGVDKLSKRFSEGGMERVPRTWSSGGEVTCECARALLVDRDLKT